MGNMAIYDKVRAVPAEAKKEITAGRLKGMSDINPMWRIKVLTELFGPCGVGWWYTITDKRIVDDDTTHQRAAFVDVVLYYIDPATGKESHGVPGTGGSSFVAQERNGAYLSDECFKMALTDALSVACKALGVGADVYYAKDRTKYTSPAQDDKQGTTAAAKQAQAQAEPVVEYAAQGQIEYIMQIATDDQKNKMQQAYGTNLERMTRKDATNAIAKLRRVNGIE